MNNKGFSFIECILAVGIISIIAISILPIIESSSKQFSNITIKNELRNIAQSNIEILKSESYLSDDLIGQLETKDSIEVKVNNIDKGYKCIIYKIYNAELLMEVEVVVSNYKDKDVEEIVLKASIKKQERLYTN